ncbi:hypothetical protein AC579_9442 [Pseudocercospora musae]|uniref:Uncharacterized protein n=1 Tax=Pseudocercospora musae TaxID=113226 RepID=A0A139HHU8_9PEZI|nr:hypothetical protein AC579_9442 [Pseudocercospora musae]
MSANVRTMANLGSNPPTVLAVQVEATASDNPVQISLGQALGSTQLPEPYENIADQEQIMLRSLEVLANYHNEDGTRSDVYEILGQHYRNSDDVIDATLPFAMRQLQTKCHCVEEERNIGDVGLPLVDYYALDGTPRPRIQNLIQISSSG